MSSAHDLTDGNRVEPGDCAAADQPKVYFLFHHISPSVYEVVLFVSRFKTKSLLPEHGKRIFCKRMTAEYAV